MVEPATAVAQACPPEQALVELALGHAGAAAETLRDHLDVCEACRTAVVRLARSNLGDVLEPDTLVAGRYRVGRLLGRGGMGEVHEAWDQNLERRVALKTLTPRAADPDDAERRVARLVRESKVMARVRHPNVVAVYDAGQWRGRAYVVMELVDGETLRAWCLRARRSWSEIVEMFVAAGRGLHAANAEGIVHRDFKPDNVLVDEHGRVQVTDFGLAQRPDDDPGRATLDGERPPSELRALDDSGSLTQTGMVVGTPVYMAPEQFKGQDVDVRADVFAFCVALYEALAGRRPFEGADVRALLAAQRRGPSDGPLRARGVPGWLVEVVRAGLHHDAAARPPDVATLLRRLQRPATRRWPWAVAALGAAALGVAAARPSPGVCVDDALAGLWNDDVRVTLAAAEPSRASFAAGPLDRWATGWRAAWAEACGAGDDAEAGLRRACLIGQRGAFAAVVEGLRAGELDVAQAERGLPSVRECDADRELAQRIPEPDDPELREQAAALREELSELEGLLVGSGAAALEGRCRAAHARARALGFRPLEAEALIVVALHQVAVGQPREARATFTAAAQLASASGHDAAAALAWTHLVELEAEHLHEDERGREYADNALASIERLGPSPEADARLLDLHFARGTLLWGAGEGDAALAEFRSAEALARGGDPADLLGILEGTAIVLEDQGKIREAIALHEEVAAQRGEARTGPAAALCRILDRRGLLEAAVPALPGEDDRRRALFALREAVPEGVNARVRDAALRSGEPLSKSGGDVIVPFDRFAEALARYRTILAETALDSAIWGHISDGNVHPNLVATDAAAMDRARAAQLAIGEVAIALGGSPLAEHGTGRNPAKKRLLAALHGEAGVASMRATKRALDPHGLFAPGVLFDAN